MPAIFVCDQCQSQYSPAKYADDEFTHKSVAVLTRCDGTYHRVWSSEQRISANSESEAALTVKEYRDHGHMARYCKVGHGLNAVTGAEIFTYDVYYRMPANENHR